MGSDVYDWSLEGRIRQFQDYLRQIQPGQEDLMPLMRQAMDDWTLAVVPEEIGTVLTVDSEIATVSGLEHAQYGEILLFSFGIKGMVQDLRRGEVSCILFGDAEEISAGSIVRRTKKTAGMPVGDGFLGRVVIRSETAKIIFFRRGGRAMGRGTCLSGLPAFQARAHHR